MNINDCIRIMKERVEDPHAKNYLSNISESIDYAGSDGLRVQLMYVLNNCTKWKGEEAREVKKFVRKWIKEKKNENSPL